MLKKIFLTAGILFALQASAAAVTFESTERQVTVAELYTSQGCGNCPPAEDWIRSFRSQSSLWKSFVPLVFHVDYKNKQGWKDPFSSGEFTSRQRQYTQLWRMNMLLTPCVVIQGRLWANWGRIKTLPTFNQSVGVLRVDQQGPGRYRVLFDPKDKKEKKYDAHIALLGFNIESTPAKGENAGKPLKHDFVVLQYDKVPMDGFLQPTAAMNLNTRDSRAPRLGLAAWVTMSDSPVPVQATGGYLD
ncbi:MAG TPA: DUF1223 domain-containing protein [Candidatus Omnitrophota bacterium]|nr:DUF1223 domain-containing protein [Candidatus Omnitrophota bacterium]